ncbi:MAG: YigZ family protein [Bacteroidia bacterium]|nr:MAG: YigZ family protein [Bacteroidia bacterium]
MAALDYRTIAAPCEGLYKDRGSRFLAYALPAASVEVAMAEVARLRAQHHAARHCCYAYVLGAEGDDSRANDDGEPSGSAGRPILGVLLSRELRDVLVVVIRYFGGIKLGVPGLIAAYRGATEDALDQAEVVVRTVERHYALRFDYGVQHEVMEVLKRVEARVEGQDYGADCRMRVAWSLAMDDEACQRLEKICGIVAVE